MKTTTAATNAARTAMMIPVRAPALGRPVVLSAWDSAEMSAKKIFLSQQVKGQYELKPFFLNKICKKIVSAVTVCEK